MMHNDSTAGAHRPRLQGNGYERCRLYHQATQDRSYQEVHAGTLLPDLLLHRSPTGCHHPKGGLGFPVIISVFVFIIFYILDNTGYRMSRLGTWTIWFGQGLAPAVLAPIAVFVTYKATNDSTVFNMEMYKMFFMKLLGLRIKRHVFGKEVIIEEPKYTEDAQRLESSTAISIYIIRYTS